ncbi:hypothetical protein [Streptomyces sp. NPDC018000]|uniref:hypothetical protein n=1 Tax=Streptomyces sp. NPDC018000 TaxID=3365028 RepID=UPI00378D253F
MRTVGTAGHGRPLAAEDRRVFLACAAQFAASRENYRRRQQAAEAEERVAHALRRSPAEAPPRVEAASAAGRVDTRLVDHGPPTPEAAQREPNGGHGPTSGVLRLCADLAPAIGGTLRWEETTGGGLTSVLSLPAAAEP